jgi:hypothetical protein
MGRVRSTHGRDEKLLQICSRKSSKEDRLEDLGVNGRAIVLGYNGSESRI